MVIEGIVLGQKISIDRIEIDKAKLETIEKFHSPMIRLLENKTHPLNSISLSQGFSDIDVEVSPSANCESPQVGSPF